MSQMPPVQQSGVVAFISDFKDPWEEISGGIPTTAYVEHYEGGDRIPEHLPGTTSFTDITLRRAYKPDRDAAVVAWHNAFIGGVQRKVTVTKQIRAFAGVVVQTEKYAECQPVSVETPEGKAGDNAIGMITVVLKVGKKLA